MMVSGMLGRKPAPDVTRADALLAQGAGQGRHLLMELRIAELSLATAFGVEDDGWPFIAPAQQVFREVEAGIGEPACARHPIPLFKNPFALVVGDDAGVIPETAPEGGGLLDAPLPEFGVGFEMMAFTPVERAHEVPQSGRGDAGRSWRPQRFIHRCPLLFLLAKDCDISTL